MKRDVVVLGVHDGHNSGAALIKNGKVLAAISEERLNNIKNYSGVPVKAIRKVFEIAKLKYTDVDIMSIVGLTRTSAPLVERTLFDKVYESLSPWIHSRLLVNLSVQVLHKFREMTELRDLFRQMGIANRKVIFPDHHLCHAACAYYQRPWEDKTLILTLDGSGDGLSATVSIGKGFEIKRIASTLYYDSLSNNLYSEITGYLGLKRWEHEYKVMGLAPYGRPDYCIEELRKIIKINPKNPLEFQNTAHAYLLQLQRIFRKRLAEQRFDNIAAACQTYFEELVIQWVRNCIRETGIRKLASAGGAFLNVKANKLIREMGEVEDVFFYPAADDGGTPVGAALEAYYRFCEREGIEPERYQLADLYYGVEYDDEYFRHVLQKTGWLAKASYVQDIEGEITEMIAKGKIIARFSGRDEWGPRALGNRSILADPRDIRVIRKINFAIKHRDFWMPFAPSILEEQMNDYLVNARPARYMIEAFDTSKKAEEIITGLHPHDRTARPQTVNKWNPSYRKVLEGFQHITGVGAILNTSFNLHGYPIVGTPEVALWTVEQSDLDGLAIGNWLVQK